MKSSHCDQSELLSDYVVNGLPDAVAEQLDEHVAECAVCSRMLKTILDESPAPGWLALARQRATLHKAAEGPSRFPGVCASIAGTQRYHRVRRAGSGGMGVVWEGWDELIGRPVALKELGPGNYHIHGLQRLLQEATALSRLSHPHIVSVFDVIQCDDAPTLVMEFVDGLSLSAWQQGRPLTPRDAAELTLVIVDALHHAHVRGVVHRDVKPSNVLLKTPVSGVLPRDESGKLMVKLGDFGLARIIGDATLTMPDQRPGTPSYMAPEQLLNQGSANASTDIYSVGVLLYELLTGRPPFFARDPSVMLLMIQQHDLIPPCRLQPLTPRDLETICLKCLELQPQHRYPSAEALRSDIAAFLDGKPIAAQPASRLRKLQRWVQLHRLHAAVITSTALALAGIAGAGFLSANHAKDLLEISKDSEKKALDVARSEKMLRERAELAELQAREIAAKESALRSSHRQLLFKSINIADKYIRLTEKVSSESTSSAAEEVMLDADFLAEQVINTHLMQDTDRTTPLTWSDLELAMRYISLKQFSNHVTNIGDLLNEVDRSLAAFRDAPEDPLKYIEFVQERYSVFRRGADVLEGVCRQSRDWTSLASVWQKKAEATTSDHQLRERFFGGSLAAFTRARKSGCILKDFPNADRFQRAVQCLQPLADSLLPPKNATPEYRKGRYLLRLSVLADLHEFHSADGNLLEASAFAERTKREAAEFVQWDCTNEDITPVLERLK